MQTTVIQRADAVAIVLQGRFDFNAHREFRDAVEQAIKGPQGKVEVDLAQVDYLDSSALGMLLMLRDRSKAAGKEVVLAGARGSVRQVLDIANFGKLFELT